MEHKQLVKHCIENLGFANKATHAHACMCRTSVAIEFSFSSQSQLTLIDQAKGLDDDNLIQSTQLYIARASLAGWMPY